MTFLLPQLLALLVAVPLLGWGYRVLVKRRNRRVAELAAQGFAPTDASQRLRRRRHVPFVFFFLGLALLLLGLARPQLRISVPRRDGTVILAFDVSNSMGATDLKPTRIAAAKAAARAFLAKQPSSIKVGVVAFSDGSLATQQPTNDRNAVLAAIDRLSPQGGTSLGRGIFTSLSVIAGRALKLDPNALAGGGEISNGAAGGSSDTTGVDSGAAAGGTLSDTTAASGTADPAKIDIGFYPSAAIVLLSDGENTGGPDPLQLAKLASVAGVKIYPIGIGSTEGTVLKVNGYSVATKLDETLLTEIAKNTDGTYFHAEDGASLSKVYGSIDLQWRARRELSEVTGLLTGLATLLFVIGAALSLTWFARVV